MLLGLQGLCSLGGCLTSAAQHSFGHLVHATLVSSSIRKVPMVLVIRHSDLVSESMPHRVALLATAWDQQSCAGSWQAAMLL